MSSEEEEEKEEPLLILRVAPSGAKKLSVINGSSEHNNVLKL